MSKVKITSSTVIGLPSCQRASGRKVKATQERSSGISMVSASRPYSVNGSSRACQQRLVKAAMPAAGTPLMMKGFSVSKVPWAPNLTSPPLGASGLT